MTENLDGVGRTEGAMFTPIESYERLIELRERSPDAFMLQTSAATRLALGYYERQKRNNDELNKQS